MGFPIKGSQVFTHKAPSNYSTLGPNSSTHKASSSGLSNQSKLAIGIAIPIILFLILCSLLLFWYFKLHLPDKSLHHRQSFDAEPEFQLYEKRRGEKGGATYPPISPDSPWQGNMTPTVYHPTPALALQHTHTTRHHHHASSPPPAHLRLHATTSTTSPRLSQHHQQQQQQQQQKAQYHPPTTTTTTKPKPKPRPNIKIQTGAIMAAAPSVPSSTSPSPPPRQFSRKIISPPLSSYHPAVGTRLVREEQEEEMGVGLGRREMEIGQDERGWNRREENREGEESTTKRGKFHLLHFPSLGGMLGKTASSEEKQKKKKEKKKGSGRGKKDAAGSEDLFS